jgi:hypothetical protein
MGGEKRRVQPRYIESPSNLNQNVEEELGTDEMKCGREKMGERGRRGCGCRGREEGKREVEKGREKRGRRGHAEMKG